jgi:hypothetical protein
MSNRIYLFLLCSGIFLNFSVAEIRSSSHLSIILEKFEDVQNEIFNLESFSNLCSTSLDDNDPCTDLSKIACGDFAPIDGTGRGFTKDEMGKKVSELKLQSLPIFQQHFHNLLPAKESVINGALLAFGLRDHPQCSKKTSPECTKLLSMACARLSQKEGFPYEGLWYQDFQSDYPEYKIDESALKALLINPEYLEIQQTTHLEVVKLLDNQIKTKKIREKIFPDIKKLMIDSIESKVANKKLQKRMTDRISNIKIDMDCNKKNKGFRLISELEPEAYYNAYENTFFLCGPYKWNEMSEFTLVQTIAHEMSHSIDPCNIGSSNGPNTALINYKESGSLKEFEKVFPFSGVLNCLQSPNSVQAKPPENSFCEWTTELSESFADWHAAEILPAYFQKEYGTKLTIDQYRAGYANTFREGCGAMSGTHSDTKDRLNKIILANPITRQQMGCSAIKKGSGLVYCRTGIKPSEYISGP